MHFVTRGLLYPIVHKTRFPFFGGNKEICKARSCTTLRAPPGHIEPRHAEPSDTATSWIRVVLVPSVDQPGIRFNALYSSSMKEVKIAPLK